MHHHISELPGLLPALISMDNIAVIFFLILQTWVLFLVYDSCTRPHPPPLHTILLLQLHTWPAAVLLAACKVAHTHRDPIFVGFLTLVFYRHYKTLINLFMHRRYIPAEAPKPPRTPLTACDTTVIVPTVGLDANLVFTDVITGILCNRPRLLVLSCNSVETRKIIKKETEKIKEAIDMGLTDYQRMYQTGIFHHKGTDIRYVNTKVSNKREQMIEGAREAEGINAKITCFADDTAIWKPGFLDAALLGFESENVGLVGTRKWVRRLSYVWDDSLSWLHNLWNQYCHGFWNTMGGVYLIRHNFELAASQAADGGVFCISGRTFLVRSDIVNDPHFQKEFLNDYMHPLGKHRWKFGPLSADDDNFVVRWMLKMGRDIKVQLTEEATMMTTLGVYPKYLGQCERWSRTTLRQNPVALFADRDIWWRWPVTVWTTYVPWMVNAALIWDPLMYRALTRTQWYANSDSKGLILGCFIAGVWASKLMKSLPWFWEHPVDFLLYFFPIPAQPLFAYWHSIIKLRTAVTFWSLEWPGRELPKANDVQVGASSL